jgi:hypothetical protein
LKAYDEYIMKLKSNCKRHNKSTKLDMIDNVQKLIFKLVISYGCTWGKKMKGEGKKLKLILYGAFKIIRKISDNSCQLDLPQYVKIYSVVNVENLKSFEPSMLDDDSEENLHLV